MERLRGICSTKLEKTMEEKDAGLAEAFKIRALFRRKPEYDTGQHPNQ
ncbi:hypothetical protein SAMN05720354_12151 [Nitrosospira sp. Nsp1]|nr:hypothetical protein SAMN05720354_12151 [Nitrosospira sp. Nsp1]